MAMLRPAEEMKDSGIEWVGSVPQDWNVVPIGSCFDEVVKKNKEGLVKNALKFTYGQIVPKTNFDADEDDYVADTILNYYIVDPGTIMINGLNLNFDLISQRTGLVKERGIITSAYVGIIPKDYSVTLPDFMNYLFKAYDYRMAFHNMGGGVRKILNFTRLKSQKVCFPTITEQQAIASYLDDRCCKLDEIITEAEKSIEEYKELKQAVIFEAVTKGLDKNVPMKNSGVDWIGELPSSWSLVRIPRILDYRDSYPLGDGDHGMIKTEDYQNDGIPYIRVQNLGWGTDLLLDNVVYISEEDNEKIKSSQLKPNDVLFCKTGGTIGKTGMVPVSLPVSNTTSHVGKITVNPDYNARYVFYVLSSYVGYRQFWEIACQKTTRPELSIAETRQIRLTWPSSRQEQDDIVQYLDNIIPEYNVLIAEKQSLVEDLKAYKKSLIYEVVTGKRRIS